MAQRLVAIVNISGEDAKYSSTEYSQDATPLPNYALTRLGGNFVVIADCSDSTLFDAHHCTVESARKDGWTATFWNDDEKFHLFYWSDGDFYSEQSPAAGSEKWEYVALVVAPGPVIYCTEWT